LPSNKSDSEYDADFLIMIHKLVPIIE